MDGTIKYYIELYNPEPERYTLDVSQRQFLAPNLRMGLYNLK